MVRKKLLTLGYADKLRVLMYIQWNNSEIFAGTIEGIYLHLFTFIYLFTYFSLVVIIARALTYKYSRLLCLILLGDKQYLTRCFSGHLLLSSVVHRYFGYNVITFGSEPCAKLKSMMTFSKELVASC